MSSPRRRRGRWISETVGRRIGQPLGYVHRDRADAKHWQKIMRSCGERWSVYPLGGNLIHNGGRPKKL